MTTKHTEQAVETVAIRFPKGLWQRVRMRALGYEESGLSYLSRCAERCLAEEGSDAPNAEKPNGVATVPLPRRTGSVTTNAAGDPVVRRAEGGGSSDPRDAASAPVRLGQAASIQGGSVVEKNESAAHAEAVISGIMVDEHRSTSRDPVRLRRAIEDPPPVDDRRVPLENGRTYKKGDRPVLTIPGASTQPVCWCGHSAAAHKDFTGRCQFGPGCEHGCRKFEAEDPSDVS